MRRLILAGIMTTLVGAAAMAQDARMTGSDQSGGMPSVSLQAGSDDAMPTANRVYTLPPEVDVDVTGSIESRRCVGDTMGQRMCQDTTTEAAR